MRIMVSSRRKNKPAEKRRKKLLVKKYQYIWLGGLIVIFCGLAWVIFKFGYYEMAQNKVTHEFSRLAFSGSKSLGLIIKDIYVEGHVHTPLNKIKKKLQTREGEPILFVSVQDMRDEIMKLEWVNDVIIERHIPSTLHVRIKEKVPVAVWQNKGELALIDKEGEVISRSFILDFPGLPLVVGERANLNFVDIYEVLSSEKPFDTKLSSIISVNGRRWNIRLDNGVEIMLPENKPEKALLYLAKLHKKNKILERKLKYIDMRIEDRVFIKTANKPAFEEKEEILPEENEKSNFEKVIDAIESIKKKD